MKGKLIMRKNLLRTSLLICTLLHGIVTPLDQAAAVGKVYFHQLDDCDGYALSVNRVRYASHALTCFDRGPQNYRVNLEESLRRNEAIGIRCAPEGYEYSSWDHTPSGTARGGITIVEGGNTLDVEICSSASTCWRQIAIPRNLGDNDLIILLSLYGGRDVSLVRGMAVSL